MVFLQVTIRKWKISCRKRDHLEKPKEQKRSLDEFLQDAWTHGLTLSFIQLYSKPLMVGTSPTTGNISEHCILA